MMSCVQQCTIGSVHHRLFSILPNTWFCLLLGRTSGLDDKSLLPQFTSFSKNSYARGSKMSRVYFTSCPLL